MILHTPGHKLTFPRKVCACPGHFSLQLHTVSWGGGCTHGFFFLSFIIDEIQSFPYSKHITYLFPKPHYPSNNIIQERMVRACVCMWQLLLCSSSTQEKKHQISFQLKMFFPVKTDTKIRGTPGTASMRAWVWIPCIRVKARHHSTGAHWLNSLDELELQVQWET